MTPGPLWSYDQILPRFRILISYHYAKRKPLAELLGEALEAPFPQVFLDSGAFTAATLGTAIDLDAYIRYVHDNQAHITAYANLDVIGDAQATWANQERMEAAGLQPIPAFHMTEPWEFLEFYLERYPYIGLGGLTDFRPKKATLMGWLVQCFKRAQGRAVFHGFGMTSWEPIRSLPWYSIDSTTWSAGNRHGKVPVFIRQSGKLPEPKLGRPQIWWRVAQAVRELGFDPADFSDRSRNDRDKINALALISFLLSEEWLAKRHGQIAIPGQDHDLGPKIYLANTELRSFAQALALLKAMGSSEGGS